MDMESRVETRNQNLIDDANLLVEESHTLGKADTPNKLDNKDLMSSKNPGIISTDNIATN
jgi:hypothetical protein